MVSKLVLGVESVKGRVVLVVGRFAMLAFFFIYVALGFFISSLLPVTLLILIVFFCIKNPFTIIKWKTLAGIKNKHSLPSPYALVACNVTIGVFAAHFANRKPIRVSITLIEPIRLIVNLLRRIADALLPMLRPVQILVL